MIWIGADFLVRQWLRVWPVLQRLEPTLLIVIAGAAAGLWVFIGVADEVFEGETRAIDAAILLALRVPGDPADPLGPRWLEEFARDVTAFGSIGVIVLVVVATLGFLLLAGRRRTALLVLAASLGGGIISTVLKGWFGRPRPELVPHGMEVFSASFPSGHAMMSAVVYLTLGALIARLAPTRALKIYVLAVAGFVVVLVGVSRVYLGVHWPTDVLAGWSAGAAWAFIVWGIAQAFGLAEPGRRGNGGGPAGPDFIGR